MAQPSGLYDLAVKTWGYNPWLSAAVGPCFTLEIEELVLVDREKWKEYKKNDHNE